MQRDVILTIMGILKTAYAKFYADMTRKEAEETIALWQEMFSGSDPVILTMAVKELINTFKYPPTIADVKEKMYSLTNNEVDNMTLWNELDKAARNCLYREQEVFDRLSPLVKKFVGNPAQLRELAMTDQDTFATVTKGQFLKQLDILKKREKEAKMMLPESRQLIENLTDSFKLIE